MEGTKENRPTRYANGRTAAHHGVRASTKCTQIALDSQRLLSPRTSHVISVPLALVDIRVTPPNQEGPQKSAIWRKGRGVGFRMAV